MAWSTPTKQESIFAGQTKNTGVLTNQSKTVSTFSGQSMSSSIFDDGVEFLLKEDSFFLLLESGGKIVLDQSSNYARQSKYNNQIKH